VFGTRLTVAHLGGKRWQLLDPLVWEDDERMVIIRRDFQTDFASIPKPLRWLLDNAGANSEAAVLHDALWRESKRPQEPGIDPWDADSSFRVALRETGSTMLVRSLMWFGVRAAAMLGGRFGRRGPRFVVKVGQLLGVFALGVVTALGPTLVALGGLAVFWVANWIVALVCWPLLGARDNRPWPLGAKGTEQAETVEHEARTDAPPKRLLDIIDVDSETARAVREAIANSRWVADEKVAAILREHDSPRLAV
jgi:hypothetical protein